MSAGSNLVFASLVTTQGLVAGRAVWRTKPAAGLQLRTATLRTITAKAVLNLVGTTEANEIRCAHIRNHPDEPENSPENNEPRNQRFMENHREQNAQHETTESDRGDE